MKIFGRIRFDWWATRTRQTEAQRAVSRLRSLQLQVDRLANSQPGTLTVGFVPITSRILRDKFTASER